jgi:effector-binding domain-containing protein
VIAEILNELDELPRRAPLIGYFNIDMQNINFVVGFPVAKQRSGDGENQNGYIPGRMAATDMHIGLYNEIEPAYNALTAFI